MKLYMYYQGIDLLARKILVRFIPRFLEADVLEWII